MIDMRKEVVRLFLSGVISGIFLLDSLLALVVVLTERHSPTSTIAWLLVVLFLPVFGFLSYLLFGLYIPHQRRLAGLKSIVLAHDLPQGEELQQEEFRRTYPKLVAYWELIRLHFRGSGATLSTDNSVRIFADGQALFEDLFVWMNAAKAFIHLETYIVRDDGPGRQLVETLAAAVRRGVEVKLLIDGVGCVGLPRHFFTPLQQAGGQVITFVPPLSPFLNIRVNYRNHRKIAVIDGQASFVGGFNFGKEYLGQSKMGYWRDLHLCLQGSAVRDLALRFLIDWQLAGGTSTTIPASPMQAGRVPIQIVSSGPGSQYPAIMDSYLKIITTARQSITIETPYFIPSASLLDALRVAALSGVEVKIIIPRKPDHPFVHWVSQSYFEELLRVGIRFFAYENGFIHSKAVTADGTLSCIGTANFDVRSFHDNFEVNAVIYSEEVAKDLAQIIAEDLVHCAEITLREHWQRGTTERIKEAFCRLLSPLL